jgi:transposase-like protein
MGGMTPEEIIITKAIEHKPSVQLSREQKEEIVRQVVVGTMGGDRRSSHGTSNRGNVKELAEEFGVVSGTIIEIWRRHNATLRSV